MPLKGESGELAGDANCITQVRHAGRIEGSTSTAIARDATRRYLANPFCILHSSYLHMPMFFAVGHLLYNSCLKRPLLGSLRLTASITEADRPT